MLPLPAFLLLTPIEFYLLHTCDQLHHITLVCWILGEHLMVKYGPPFHEQPYPCHIKGTAQEEYQKNHLTIEKDDHSKDNNVNDREESR